MEHSSDSIVGGHFYVVFTKRTGESAQESLRADNWRWGDL